MTHIDDLTRAPSRPGRRAVSLAALAVVMISVTACDAENAGNTASATPRPSATQTTIAAAAKVSPDGITYAVAPPLGAESSLPRSELAGRPTSLETVDPSATLKKPSDVFGKGESESRQFVRAVFLKSNTGNDYTEATSFQPVYVLKDGSLVGSGLGLGWVHDGDGNRSVPLSANTLRFTSWAAFPQPGQVVVANLRSGETKTVPVPSQTIERVRWSSTDSIVASGDEGAWSIEVESAAPKAVKLPEGYVGADEVIAVDSSKGASLTSWKLDGLQKEVTAVKAPVTSTRGQTSSTNLSAATAVSLSDDFPAVDGRPAKQGILAVPLADPSSPRLLVMGESPARQKGCCQVVGFLDTYTPMFTNVTEEGVWLLTWNIETGAFGRVFLLKTNPAVPPVLSHGINFG